MGAKTDRTHWIDPVIHLENGDEVRLLDLDWKSANTQNGPIEKFNDIAKTGLALPKKATRDLKRVVERSLASTVVYELPEGAVRFTARVAMEPSPSGIKPEGEFHATPQPISGLAKRSGHATPDSARILPHLAAHSLVSIGDEDALLDALGTKSSDLATGRFVTCTLISSLRASSNTSDRLSIRRNGVRLTTLARLYQKEAPYDGSWWWTTRPDTHGPYYKPVTWSASPAIRAALESEWENSDGEGRATLTGLNDSHRLGIDKFGTFLVVEKEAKVDVDFSKIASQKARHSDHSHRRRHSFIG